MNTLKRVGILGLSYYVPDRVIDNEYFVNELGLDTSDEWIVQRTGIKQRRFAREDEYTSDMAANAAKGALKDANVRPEEIDFLLVGTATPDYQFPNTANIVHKNLELRPDCGAVDTPSGCSSFVYALALGSSLVKSGEAKKVLVVGADKLSTIMDPKDRSTVVIFSDAAGAVVLGETAGERELLSHTYGCELNIEALYRPMSGVREFPTQERFDNRRQFARMKGREIYMFAVRKFHDEILYALKKAGLSLDDLSYIIPHQVNIRIIKSAAEKLRFPIERVYVNIDRYGNSSAGTIPVALAEAYQNNWFKTGDVIGFVAFGAGLSWGAGIIRW